LPSFGSSASNDSKKPYVYAQATGDSPQAVSTAVSREEDPPPVAKTPATQKHEVGSVRQATDDVKKLSDPSTTGIVELEVSMPKKLDLPMPELLPIIEAKAELEPFLVAMQCMLDGRHQEALKHLSAYDNDKQEVFLRLAPMIETFVKKRMEELTTAEIANMLKGLDGLRDSLRPRSELVVSKMLCCKEVRGYGWYIPLPESHSFLAGTPERVGEQVKLYVELKNFASEPTKEGEFITKLSCALELRDAKKVVWSTKFEGNETTLKRSSRLNDLYSLYGFYVPAVPPGSYQLTLRIADETNPKSVRIASKSMEFRVTPVAGTTHRP
jgi:hypothetical protein